MCKNKKGFTLVELMVTIAVAAILLTIGVPSLTSVYEQVRVNNNVEKIHNLFAFARNQAISYGATVNVCPFESTNTCGTDWSNGIRIYINSDDLRIIDSFNGNDKVNGPSKISGTNPNGAHITFSPEGLSSGGTIIYCPAGKASNSKSISVSTSGKVSYGADGSSC